MLLSEVILVADDLIWWIKLFCSR